MKDFIFTDPSESTAKVVYRTDLLGTNENFTVHQITGLENVQTFQQKKVLLLKTFGLNYYSKAAFKAFALANGLDLTMQDSNGENAEILIDYNSDALAQSW